MAYDAALRARDTPIESVDTHLTVVDRGTWGELRFRAEPDPAS